MESCAQCSSPRPATGWNSPCMVSRQTWWTARKERSISTPTCAATMRRISRIAAGYAHRGGGWSAGRLDPRGSGCAGMQQAHPPHLTAGSDVLEITNLVEKSRVPSKYPWIAQAPAIYRIRRSPWFHSTSPAHCLSRRWESCKPCPVTLLTAFSALVL